MELATYEIADLLMVEVVSSLYNYAGSTERRAAPQRGASRYFTRSRIEDNPRMLS